MFFRAKVWLKCHVHVRCAAALTQKKKTEKKTEKKKEPRSREAVARWMCSHEVLEIEIVIFGEKHWMLLFVGTRLTDFHTIFVRLSRYWHKFYKNLLFGTLTRHWFHTVYVRCVETLCGAILKNSFISRVFCALFAHRPSSLTVAASSQVSLATVACYGMIRWRRRTIHYDTFIQ